jgi:putative endonuclease
MASSYLQAQGLQLIEANYHSRVGEVDLIMQDQGTYVFVEVRMRSSSHYGSGIESITRRKQHKVIRTATLYLQQKRLLNRVHCRFDVVGLSPVGTEMEIRWIPNAFC